MAPKAYPTGLMILMPAMGSAGPANAQAPSANEFPPFRGRLPGLTDAPGSSVSSRSSGIVLRTFAVARDH